MLDESLGCIVAMRDGGRSVHISPWGKYGLYTSLVNTRQSMVRH